MGSLEVIMDRRELLEERDVEVVLIDVRLSRKKPVVDRVWVEQVARRRVVGLDLFRFIRVDIPSELDRSTPTSFSFVYISAFEGVHEVFRGTHASNQIGGVHERREVNVPLTGRGKASSLSDFLTEIVLSESSRSSLVNGRQLDKVEEGTWCEGVVRIESSLSSESIVLLELDYKVLCSMWSAPISFVPKSRGTS